MRNPLKAKAVDPARLAELERAGELALFGDRGSLPEDARAQFFELYKIMVASSEALVARRQGLNTFFLTANGLILTAVGLFLGVAREQIAAAALLPLTLAGLLLDMSWRALLVSYGQLNSGKFRVINSMEAHLAAAVYLAEWKALAEGREKSVYQSFTEREAFVPRVLSVLYLLGAIVSGVVLIGVLHVRLN